MPLPTPHSDEKQADFVARCHEAISGEFPETDQRNAVCFRQWRESKGPDELQRKAHQKFGEDKYQFVPDVVQFAEHTTKDRDGNTVVYDKAALELIAKRCNERIHDTGDFAPLTEGHTPSQEDVVKGARMPDVLGYVGPYRLGMIGNKSPRWAIVADEWHHKQDVPKLQKLRRRSPELWLEERMEDRFFDPIAALGAETPRLDMGMVTYHRLSDQRLVAKYSAASPAVGDVFVPSEDVDKKNHSAGDQPMALTPEDVKQIVDAIEQLDWVQYVKAEMAAGQAEPEEGAVADGAGEQKVPEGPPAEAPDKEAPPKEEPAPEDKSKDSYQADDKEPTGDEDVSEKTKDYSAAGSVEDCPDKPGKGDVEQFARDSAEKAKYARMEERLTKAEAELESARKKELKAERYAKLQTLRMQEGCVLDVEKELEDAVAMTSDQFDRHVTRIRECYQRAPVGARPLYVPDGLPQKTEQSERDLYSKAQEIHTRSLRSGDKSKHLSWDDCIGKAKEELAGATKTK